MRIAKYCDCGPDGSGLRLLLMMHSDKSQYHEIARSAMLLFLLHGADEHVKFIDGIFIGLGKWLVQVEFVHV